MVKKNTLGWNKYKSPSIIVKNEKTNMTFKEISDSLNQETSSRQKPAFTLSAINMTVLRSTINQMEASPSTGIDMIFTHAR